MGLGKTFIGSEKMKNLNTKINLVVCQKSKINDWYSHFKQYYSYMLLNLTKKVEYDYFINNNDNYVIGFINYDLIWRRDNLLKLKDFTLILDESSCIKSMHAKRTKFILKMKPLNVILLSGTPVGGKYEELYSQCKLLGWEISERAFWNTYIDFINTDVGGFPIRKVIGYKNVDRLKYKLQQHGAIFKKSNEVLDLPEQSFITVNVDNTLEYKKFKKHRLITIENKELVGDTSLTNLLYLRQLASQYNKHKLGALKDILESTNDRLIIFYNFNDELEKINNLCFRLERSTSVINGKTKDLYEYENTNNSVTLVQYQAGAMGLNLQKSNKIIYYSLPLSSDLFEQSKKRIHRIGQDKSCFYYYLLAKNSIEVEILNTLEQRKDFTDELFKEIEGGYLIDSYI